MAYVDWHSLYRKKMIKTEINKVMNYSWEYENLMGYGNRKPLFIASGKI